MHIRWSRLAQQIPQYGLILLFTSITRILSAEPIQIARGVSADSTSSGRTTVPVPPEYAFKIVSSIADWPHIFSDIRKAEVISSRTVAHQQQAATKLLSNTIGHEHQFTVEIDSQRKLIRYGVANPHFGMVFSGFIKIAAGTQPKTTQIELAVTSDVKGVWGAFIPDRKIEHKRRSKVEQDLSDLQQFFRNGVHR